MEFFISILFQSHNGYNVSQIAVYLNFLTNDHKYNHIFDDQNMKKYQHYIIARVEVLPTPYRFSHKETHICLIICVSSDGQSGYGLYQSA